jgi:preprotein translocase subunit SecG
MSWVHGITLGLHLVFAVAIVGLVLLQRGKGAEAGAGFGAGASGTVFGARGSASFLSRSTAVLAALFFATSLALAYMGGRTTGPTSVTDTLPASTATKTEKPAPTTPIESTPRQSEQPAAPAPETPAK